MESIQQFVFSRMAALRIVEHAPEEKWDSQPGTFPNTIRWNAGHIYVSAEVMLNMADESYTVSHPEWNALFASGTRPSEWTGEKLEAAEIIEALREQSSRIEKHFAAKMGQEASKPLTIGPLEMKTVDAILQFVVFHESVHAGMIKTLSHV